MSVDLLVLACHPDDAELGMGGTIAASVATGKKVVIVDLTNGEPTPYGSIEIRAKESKLAKEKLGVKEYRELDIVNREIFDTVENRKKIAEVIREYKPKSLFIHYPDDAHPDHVQASSLSVSARFYSKLSNTDIKGDPFFPKKIFYFISIHKKIAIKPDFVFDITHVFDKKIEAAKAYASQFMQNPKNVEVIDYLEHQASYFGRLIGVKYGEPFVAFEPLGIKDISSII